MRSTHLSLLLAALLAAGCGDDGTSPPVDLGPGDIGTGDVQLTDTVQPDQGNADSTTTDTAIGDSGSTDADNDGYTVAAGDCDDSNADVNPGATEVCNGVDDNCDGNIDEGVMTTYFKDGDGDNYGVDDAATNKDACDPPQGYVSVGGDCDDSEPLAYPGNAEVCDGIDNDCNGTADDGVTLNTYYQDGDSDGYGDDSVTQQGCVPPSTGTWVTQGGDCDDSDADRFPGNTEICDGKDNDCDSSTPEPGATTYYKDGDGDGYGDDNVTQSACGGAPTGYVSTGGDCDDSDAAINPGAIELCDGIDNNCINGVDEGPVATWVDSDGDGFGAEGTSAVYLCEVKTGYAANNTDCDDSNANINPDAAEIPGNGTDENCDGVDTSAGTLCGNDSMSATSIPYTYNGSLSSGDQSTGGPRGAGYYWDDVELSTTGGENITVLYASKDPSAMRPYLYVYGPNSCSTLVTSSIGSSQGSPKGSYFSRGYINNAAAGYYYIPVTTYTAGQLGTYLLEFLPGKVGTSCGSDIMAIWPLGWRLNHSLSTFDTQSTSSTPVPSGVYADDFEFYLEQGQLYTVLMGGTNFSERIYLAKAEACGTTLASATSGISNGGALIRYTPSTSGVYVGYAATVSAGTTGSFTFNVVKGDVGKSCFDGPGSITGTGDSAVLYPLGGAVSGSLTLTDRSGDFGARLFDDYETYLEVGDQITVTMTRVTGTYSPYILLTRAGACTTTVKSAVGPTTATLTYTATTAGIYTIVASSSAYNATGSYTLTTSVN